MSSSRNERCHCGSGRTTKHGHGRDGGGRRPAARPTARISGGVGMLSQRSNPKQRQCRECQACCGPALRINEPEIVVPRGETCEHLCERGCSRWGRDLPNICRLFMCDYLTSRRAVTVEERPDHVGTIVQRAADAGGERMTLLVECLPQGLHKTLRNRVWGPLILKDLRARINTTISFVDDPLCVESLRIRGAEGKLYCDLTACDERGAPLLIDVEPAHARPMQVALMPANLDFAFDADALIEHAGDNDVTVLTPGGATGAGTELRFRISRRQVALLRDLLELLRSAGVEDEAVAAR